MSVKSQAQMGLMRAALSGTLKGAGPSPAVAKEFIDKTPSSKKSAFAFGKKKKKKFGFVKDTDSDNA